MERLANEDIEEQLSGLPGWRREGEEIVRELELADFAAAIEFVNSVARLAEAANHHPDILIHGWNQVRLSVATHSAGGLTAADFALAKEIEQLV